MSSENLKLKNNAGLTTKIDNMSVTNSLDNYLINENINVFKKITQKGRVYSLMILEQTNELNGYKNSDFLSTLFGINCKDRKNRIKKVKKSMEELYPIITYDFVQLEGLKEWHYSNIKINFMESLHGFTQLPCDLLKIPNIKTDHLVIFVILNYYRYKYNNININPSHKTIAKMAKCSERKVFSLLEEGKELGLWVYEAEKYTRSTNIYNISYYDRSGIECYYFRDKIRELELENTTILNSLITKKVDNL